MHVFSLQMVTEFVDGKYLILAPWLEEPVSGDTFEDAYDQALRKRPK